MRMGNAALGDTTAGKIVNLLSNDLLRFDMAFLFLHFVWIIPIQMVAVCYLGYRQAGYAALIGLTALVLIALPIQGEMFGTRDGKCCFSTGTFTVCLRHARTLKKLVSDKENLTEHIIIYALACLLYACFCVSSIGNYLDMSYFDKI